METFQKLDLVNGTEGGEIIMTELAGAIVNEGWLSGDLGTVFLGSELKEIGTGDPASNLRFKSDKETNNTVIKNTLALFKNYHATQKRKPNPEPIVVTSVPRKSRYITYSLTDTGAGATIHAHNTEKEILEAESTQILKFCEYMRITPEKLLQMRESTKGAGYRTYMADLISFIYMINYYYHSEMFEKKRIEAYRVPYGSINVNGDSVLQSIEIGGRTWNPRDGHDYLYFKEVSEMYDSDYTNYFFIPKEGSIVKVYSQMKELLSLEECGFKEMVRKHFSQIKEYGRVSDYWLNDVDDAFSIYMIYNCYCHTNITTQEQRIKEQLKEIIDSFS